MYVGEPRPAVEELRPDCRHQDVRFRAALEGILPESVRWRGDKADSITQHHQSEPRRQALAALHRGVFERLVGDGDDLGGCLSLEKLGRRLAESAGPAGRNRRRAAAGVSAALAVSLALFVERHGIDCG